MTRIASMVIAAIAIIGFSANAAELKVGVVNLQKIMQESPQVQQVKSRLKNEFAPQQTKILNKQQALQSLEKKLRSTAPKTDADREAMQMKAATLRHDIQQLRNDFLDDLNLRRNQELGKLQRMVVEEVNRYAAEHGFDLVIGDGVFYASPRVNITSDIIEKLGRDFKKSGGKLQPAAEKHDNNE